MAYILGHSTHGHPKSSTAGCVGSITVSPDASHAGANNIYAWFFASYTDLGAPPLQGSDDVFLYDPLASFPDVIASCESFGGTFSLGGSNPDSYWTCAAWDSADVAEFETRDALLATACVSSARIFHTASAETDANPWPRVRPNAWTFRRRRDGSPGRGAATVPPPTVLRLPPESRAMTARRNAHDVIGGEAAESSTAP